MQAYYSGLLVLYGRHDCVNLLKAYKDIVCSYTNERFNSHRKSCWFSSGSQRSPSGDSIMSDMTDKKMRDDIKSSQALKPRRIGWRYR